MLKNIFKLMVLISLSIVLAYSVFLNKTELLLAWEQIIVDQQNNVISQPAQQPNRSDVVIATSSQQPVSTNPKVIPDITSELVEHELSQDQQDFQCTTTPLEKITVKKQVKIYRWKDDNGKIHFGDSSFQQAPTQDVKLKHRKVLEYFNLKMSGNEQPTRFKDRLSTRINKVYLILSNLIPDEKLDKVTVDLRIFNNINDYRHYSNKFSTTLGRQSNGFYIMRNNQAVVYKRNEDHAGQVALHESTHVINAGIFGYTPRWLNEGLAEYMESMTVSGQVAEIPPNASWSTGLRLKPKFLVELDYLFSANSRQWGRSPQARSTLYATSWSLIYFLMSSEENTKWLGKLLSDKADNRCEHTITRDYMDNLYPGGIANLQLRFDQWVRSGNELSVHRY